MTFHRWIQRHPLLAYFALAYGISWGGILIALSFAGLNTDELRRLDAKLIFALMLLGPSIGGVALTATLEGRAGLRRLGSSLTRWKAGMGWYAVALLTMPLLMLAVLWPLSIFVDPAFAPRFQWPLFAIGLVAGGFEEIGWSGFAAPRLLARLRLLWAGLALGLVWALWHLLVDLYQDVDATGTARALEFVVFYGAALTAYRLLMMWVYANTRSVLLAVLMHATYTGWLFVLYPDTSFDQDLVWKIAFAAALWVAVAAVFGDRARRVAMLARQPEHFTLR